MLPFLLVLSGSDLQPELPRRWAQFSRSGALSHVRETVEIATGDRGDKAEFRYKLRFTKRSLRGKPEIKWADSATCPAVRSVIIGMRNIKMPSPAPYGLPDQSMSITLDGIGYSLTAPSSDNMGNLTISSNTGSPLAAWVDASFKQLETCWTTAAS
ncbi:hypothetical protein [Sphingomonas sp. DT-204]|uniref:hypothetical protein n=1 Tax=Sphingomonas sp. DT-204 TaxID=3396166 RepID=UPI003F1C8A75